MTGEFANGVFVGTGGGVNVGVEPEGIAGSCEFAVEDFGAGEDVGVEL